jgi:glucose-1-phosphate adenylyltransferase
VAAVGAAAATADPLRRAARISFVSSSVLTLILAGGEGERLSILSQVRAKPGVPFGGKYRIIDFALSNAVNSGLTDVGILTQYAPRSLIDHIGVGRPWDLDRSRGGVALLQPFIGRGRARDWYRGTADAVLQNLDFIADRDPELVLILAGDHVYKMDYRPFLEMHRVKGADVTCAVRTVPIEEAHRFGILDVDGDGRVTAFIEKPPNPPSNLVSMGVYVFSWPLLRDLLGSERVDFGRDILPAMVDDGSGVYAYEFAGYWQDVGTVESYWQTNLDLLSDDPGVELNDLGWLIYTRSEERPPARIGPQGSVSRSMISHGCVIDGTVEHSVLSPGVRVAAGAVVRDSIVMFDAVIESDATLDRAILDKECHIGAGARVGAGDDLRPNRDEPERLYAGITLVGKRARVPRGVEIGRNCRIDPGTTERDFQRRRRIRSGETVVAGVA